MIPAFDRPDGPPAPSPHTLVTPPAPALVQAASAWRGTLRPPAPRRSGWPTAAAMALIVAALAAHVWLPAPDPDPVRVTSARSIAR